MKNLFLLIIALLQIGKSHSQNIYEKYVDSLTALQDNMSGSYEYDYSALENNGTLFTRFDFLIDTAKRQLLKVNYTEEGDQATTVTYYFYDNKLIKVVSMNRDAITNYPVGIYYFCNNKPFDRVGRNLSLQNVNRFKRISFSYISKQQGYLLREFKNFIDNELPVSLADKIR